MDATEREALGRRLRREVRGDVLLDAVSRGLYATDASIYQIEPVGVVLPRDTEDVVAAVRVAGECGVSLLPRGGGTSLGGQAVGPSLVLDFSKYMDAVLEFDPAAATVRVQPGAVLDELNAFLAPHGLHFAPDPATSSRATIGGMIGNNSSGAKSILYGITQDHVLATKVVLADGTLLDLAELSPEEYDRRCRQPSREAEILAGFKTIVDAHRQEIRDRYPKVMRRVQGYNLDAFVDADRWNLSELIVGSEGTLGVVVEATLRLEPLPKCKALCVAHFAAVPEAVRAVAPILTHGPSAVEIMDADVLTRARENRNVAPLCGFLQGEPGAVLIVEFFGETPEEVAGKVADLAADLKARGRGYAWPTITEPAEQAKVWAVRKNGLGLMLGMKGDRKPTAFIEDCCVPMEVLPEYVNEVLRFCGERDVAVAMYAHASVGVIHLRPILDLRREADIDNLKAIADHAFSLVMRYRGAWSGEHGDGRVRSSYLERYFGPEVYGALREVKQLFDPAGRMNPGPIIDPPPIDRDLRYGTTYRPPPTPTVYHYRQDGSFAAAVEMCTGVGACRQKLAGTMCPSYRATRDEAHSTRGRANALRLAMTGQLGPDGMTCGGLKDVMDLCLSCKSCKSECPSNVDLTRLKAEFLQRYHDAHGLTLRDRLVAGSSAAAGMLSGWAAPLVNRVQNFSLVRRAMGRLTGFDPRRPLPEYARVPFPKWFARRGERPGGSDERTVVLFDDTFMGHHQPRVGVSAVELLESCGYRVVLARAGCCQRPRISRGLLREAKAYGEKTLRKLDVFVQRGWPVVVCEPACASALTDDLPDLIDDEALGERIRKGVWMIDVFLAAEVEAGRLSGAFRSPHERILIHGHCHQKALSGTTHMKELLDRAGVASVEELDAGCCGMAGAFGFEREHYELSMAIGEERLFPAIRDRQEGAAVVACGFSCRQQIADGTGVEAVHWVETIRGA